MRGVVNGILVYTFPHVPVTCLLKKTTKQANILCNSKPYVVKHYSTGIVGGCIHFRIFIRVRLVLYTYFLCVCLYIRNTVTYTERCIYVYDKYIRKVYSIHLSSKSLYSQFSKQENHK